MAHRTLQRPGEHLDIVKGSRFHAWVVPVDDEAEVAAALERARAARPDAHHLAWAWRLGDVLRWSDDGEPGGTAGRPMLEILLKRDLDRVLASVARVFGGVKLGAGGLARAYAGAVARAIDAATVVEVPDRRTFTARAPFADADTLLRLLAGAGVAHAPPTFAADGVHVTGSVLAAAADGLERRALEATRGRVRWSWSTAAATPPTDQRK